MIGKWLVFRVEREEEFRVRKERVVFSIEKEWVLLALLISEVLPIS